MPDGSAAPMRNTKGRPPALAALAPSRPDPADGWTPKAVGEQMIEALKWARYAAGRTGPAGFVGMRLPEALMSAEDRLAEGWDMVLEVDPADVPPMRIRPSAAQITRHLAALQWPADYLCPAHIGSARMLGLWAASKAYKRPFDAALKARSVDRSLAYRLRDKGLSIISVSLERARVPLIPGR